MKIVWTQSNVCKYGERLTPYYSIKFDRGIHTLRLNLGGDTSEIPEDRVFHTVEDAMAATGVEKIFCFKSGSVQLHDTVREVVHDKLGLVCPNCGWDTSIIELNPEIFGEEAKNMLAEALVDALRLGLTHFCSDNPEDLVPRRTSSISGYSLLSQCLRYQVTFGQNVGCGRLIAIKPRRYLCDCGAPIGDHVPNGFHCRKPL